MEWAKHITELTSEGSDTFQQMYRMEYSTFLQLCTIIHPQVQVDDKMSSCRTWMGPITVEIMLHCLLWLGGCSYQLSSGLLPLLMHLYPLALRSDTHC